MSAVPAAALAGAFALPFPLHALLQDIPALPGGVPVHGVVLDRSSGEPVPGVRVEVRRASGGPAPDGERTTNEEGRFSFSARGAGEVLLAFARIGYHPHEEALTLEAGSDVEVVAEMSPATLELEAVVVQIVRRSRLQSQGFYQRQRSTPGRFLGREEIEDRRAHHFTELVGRMPGVWVTPRPNRPGNEVRMRGGCQPTLHVDGIPVSIGESMDDFLHPDAVEAVEVYQAGQVPARFRSEGCGAVVVWTRSPGGPGTQGSFWKRMAFGAAFVAVATLLTR